ncbi:MULTISPECIES: DUF924 family protein [unclassified Polaromonas]|uniref:DUF924 family protein n=1 Tax=unclassified Polaromonas TaxID=2638319 RepID=UPI0018C94144|nr:MULTISPECIES: DUF924 family protein [unclassified Polaromonas]MBG6072520.1 uncharacterized protein (DUF924 family) [Polaromonas sp. CG_9.7]MBG6114524.1 uncharacterized protein (DUF924 family) [Polaromonas sp. CG_9.2]MDH6185528.1 uncharacterized protein (DUF924 family) [Polaromonas sp. CG_23.6]
MTTSTPHATLPPGVHLLTPTDILSFWLGDGLALGWPSKGMNRRWFLGGATLDDEIRVRFGQAVQSALQGGLATWESSLHSRLALVILLDQFTRNLFRGTARAFDGDVQARQLTLNTLAQQEDQELPWVGRVFLYMPLMHAEDLVLQEKCVASFSQLVADAPTPLKPKLQGSLDSAIKHQGIIARFGRFPYRNAVMGRKSSAEEKEFLRNGPRFGQ